MVDIMFFPMSTFSRIQRIETEDYYQYRKPDYSNSIVKGSRCDFRGKNETVMNIDRGMLSKAKAGDIISGGPVRIEIS